MSSIFVVVQISVDFIFFFRKNKNKHTNITLEISLNEKLSENITRKYNARHDILYFCLTKPHIEHFVIQFVISELVANDHINRNNTKCNVSTFFLRWLWIFRLKFDIICKLGALDNVWGLCFTLWNQEINQTTWEFFGTIMSSQQELAMFSYNLFGWVSVTVGDTMSRYWRIITISIVVNQYSCR